MSLQDDAGSGIASDDDPVQQPVGGIHIVDRPDPHPVVGRSVNIGALNVGLRERRTQATGQFKRIGDDKYRRNEAGDEGYRFPDKPNLLERVQQL